MTNTTNIFYDSEFTGLHQHTSLISIGFISECGKSFYAEFTDYRVDQVDDWLRDNVLVHLHLLADGCGPKTRQIGHATEVTGDSQYIRQQLEGWLNQFSQIQIWADAPAWDWVLLCQLFGGALSLPRHIHYMPGDFSTLLRAKNIDPDISRVQLAGLTDNEMQHNALWDARVLQAAYNKVTQNHG